MTPLSAPCPAGMAGFVLAVAAAIAVALGMPAGPARADMEAPQRIVSMNLCADELVLRLAEPGRIVSVTALSQDPEQSTVAEAARRYPANRGLAEEVIRMEPDLVVAGRYTTRSTVDLLKRVGIEVMELGVPTTLGEVEAQIERLGRRLGAEARAKALIARLREGLADLPQAGNGPAPSAIVYRPSGFAVGKGSLIDTLIAAAGLRNLAAERTLDNYGYLPLETLVTLAPDILVLNAEPGAPALAHEMLDHPVLDGLGGKVRTVPVPPRLWTCAGPAMIEAVAILKAAARNAEAGR